MADTIDPTRLGVADTVRLTASGELTAAERLGHREFAIHRRNQTF